MIIVNLATFLSLPANTVFAKYERCNFEALQIKGETTCGADDYFYQDIASAIEVRDTNDFLDKLLASESSGESLAMDFHMEGRDGCFDKEQLFAVFERKDVQQLISKLQKSIQ